MLKVSEEQVRQLREACLQKAQRDLRRPRSLDNTRDYQEAVKDWVLKCFGEQIANSKDERSHRFLEEALELVQACGTTQEDAHKLVDYVYGRPVGERSQELGGVMITLAALCYVQGLEMQLAGNTELERVSKVEIMEKIRAKQKAKPRFGPLAQ